MKLVGTCPHLDQEQAKEDAKSYHRTEDDGKFALIHLMCENCFISAAGGFLSPDLEAIMPDKTRTTIGAMLESDEFDLGFGDN